ncbi:hypothetical protein QZJ86_01145 [Methylomonas montana]|uniref:hypothetical protein n=1 Tax=Methylomonas montana TaxID=3058963 RepID=UPI002659F8E8|nr:hypothetical protein [Methylomonas montana]WKJ90771.1 hypothetical protein QZJ86_01145 [Methylomonas montana]
MYSVAINAGTSDSGAAYFFVKLNSPDCEFNVMVSELELERLRSVGDARWLARQSVAAGKCLGSSAFWSCQDGRLTVLVGPDDEAWEVCFSAPEALVNELLQEIARARANWPQ